jgi:diguanylate cyclase (GGDEF)-like protein
MLPRLYVLGARLGMDADAVNALSDQVVTEWREWGSILQVQTHDLPPFAEMAAAMPAAPAVMGEEQQFPLRILVVDDSPAILALLEKLLTAAGHTVATAANGKEGLAKAMEWQPQLIITDWVMPEMDGLALCKSLRESRAGRMMYLIILTVLEDEEKLVEAFEAGADDYIVKPFRERALKARLRAGQRVVQLQEEILLEREDVRRSAAELAVTNQRLLEAALTDSLTQLPNRRYGLERFDEEWAASARHDHPLSCMLLDIDRFKQINDTHGHDAGDAVLRQSAVLIKKAIRKEDVVCRLGGEEFLVICPAADLKSTAQAAERLRKAFEAGVFAIPGHTLKLTASIGAASRDNALAGPEALLKVADQALYAAKQAGRNRVVVFSRKPSAAPPAKN